MEVIMVTYLVS